MANTLSAQKALRQNEKKRVTNLRIKRGVRVAIKFARGVIVSKSKESEGEIKKAIKLIDKAVQKGILKKGTAARKKSRLWKAAKVTITKKDKN